MREAAAAEEFELAARLRDDLQALQRALEKQAVVLPDGTDCDVIGLAEDQLEAAVQVFYVRGGRVRGQRGWVVDKVEDVSTGELVEHFLGQVYRDDPVSQQAGRRLRTTGRSTARRSESQPERGPTGSRAARGAGAGAAAGRRTSVQDGWPARRGGRVDAPGAAARRQEGAARHRDPERDRVAGAAQDQAGQRPDHPQPGDARDPGRARARRGAAADRVLRRVQPAGHPRGRVDGGVRGRPGPQVGVPQVPDQGPGRHRRPRRRSTR